MITVIELIGIFFGVLARSLAPYLRKRKRWQDKELSQASSGVINKGTEKHFTVD